MAEPAPAPERDPRTYTPKHLADKILQSKSALEGERKQVTVLFADVKGSMDLAEGLDPEVWHAILDRFFQILADGVHRFEGTVNQYTGDGVMALFGAPIAHEDHAQRAGYAALHLRDTLRALGQELRREYGFDLRTRIGVNSGEVVVGKIGDDLRMDYTAQGHTVGLAQRMEQLAEAGKPYLTEATARLVQGFFALEDLGEFKVKGSDAPVRVFGLEGPGDQRTRFDRSRARGLSRFVGRDAESAQLDAALERATAGSGQVIGIVAEAGTGKSRLCYEFVERCRANGLQVLEAHGLAHGRTIPLRPMLEMFRSRFGIAPADDDRSAREKIAGALLLLDPSFADALPLLFDFLGVPDPERPAPRLDPELAQRQIRETFRRIVHADTRSRTVVSLIEDLHWLDAPSDALVADLVDLIPSTRGLALLNFRPEYAAEWMKHPTYQQLTLEPLGPEAARDLVRDWIGGDPSVRELPARIAERTEGNPFFAEEVVQSLIEDGSLEGERGAYRLARPLDQVPLPPTVQSVLAARIDRLPEREKRVLQAASVVGREFPGPLAGQLAGLAEPELAPALGALRRGEFLYEAELYPVARYAFKHPLTQEVAYQSQLGERRAAVHREVADWLEADDPRRLDERAAELAWHRERAGEPVAAARWHERAASWVLMRSQTDSARHWNAVYDLLEDAPATPETDALNLQACAQLLMGGWQLGMEDAEAQRLLERGRRIAERRDDPAALARLIHGYGNAILSKGRLREFLELMREVARLAEQAGDPEMQAVGSAELSISGLYCGELDEAERAAAPYESLAPADPAWDQMGLRFNTFMPSLQALLAAERGRFDEALRLQERAGRAARLSEDARTQVLVGVTRVQALYRCGDADAAMAVAAPLLEIAESYGSPHLRACARQALGLAHLTRGSHTEAVRAFEEELAIIEEFDANREWEAQDRAFLAEALLECGELERARESAERALDVATAPGREARTQEIDARLALVRVRIHADHAYRPQADLDLIARLIDSTGALSRRRRLDELRRTTV